MTAELATSERAPVRVRRVAKGSAPVFGWLGGLIVPLGVALLWEIVARNRLLSSSLFPPLSSVAAVWFDWIFGANGKALVYSGTWLQHVLASAQRVLLGFALGSSAGVMLGVLTGW